MIGTLLAMGLEEGKPNPWLDALVAAPMIIPDIVLAIALLSFYTLLNMSLGLHSIILSHAVFNIAFVCDGGAHAAARTSTARSSRPRSISAPAS